jgi:hypothetical protein
VRLLRERHTHHPGRAFHRPDILPQTLEEIGRRRRRTVSRRQIEYYVLIYRTGSRDIS